LDQARWVDAQRHKLLPVAYFHVVFTVPVALHPLFLANRRDGFSLLFKTAWGALRDVCERRLGATPGAVAVLHTWSQTLAFHPHIHYIVTGGGLDRQGTRWTSSRSGFLVPVRILSKVFRGKLLDELERSLHRGTGSIGPSMGKRLLQQAAAKSWVVYAKRPMAGPEQVLQYLGRYTQRIAIGNERLVSLSQGRVTFRYRDRRHGNAQRTMTLDGREFVRRFLKHVVPHRFVRIRHFGLQANGYCSRLVARARTLLGASVADASPTREPWRDLYCRLTGRDPLRCPECRVGTLLIVSMAFSTRTARGP